MLSALNPINYRYAAFTARTYLAILDHNHHLERDTKVTKDGDPQFRRIWRRRSKEWDVTPEKHEKSYSYIPEMIALTFREHADSIIAMRSARQILPEGHPELLQPTIAHRPPPTTSELVTKKASRF